MKPEELQKLHAEINQLIYESNDNDLVQMLLDMHNASSVADLRQKDLRSFRNALRKQDNESNSMLDAVLSLAAKGFSVFPVEKNKKTPLINGWQKNATTDAEKIKKWWGLRQEENVAIHTASANGKHLLVIDVDTKNDGDKAWEELCNQHELPDTRIHSTPSGGQHVFFYSPEPQKSSVGKIAKGIDARGVGGYVVAPPSCIDDKHYSIESDCEIAPAPRWLLQLIKNTASKAEPVTDAPSNIDQETAIERARNFLEKRAPAVQGSGGDVWTYKTVAVIRDFGVAAEHVLELLLPWNEICEPPWGPQDLQKKVTSVYSYAQNAAGAKSAESILKDFEDIPVPIASDTEQPAESDQPNTIQPMFLKGINLPDILNQEFVVDQLVPKGSDCQVFAASNVGKTFFALSMAFHVATGKEFLGHRTKRGGVLYLGYEGHVGLAKRLAALIQENPDTDLNDVPLMVIPMSNSLVTENGSDKGLQFVKSLIEYFQRIFFEFPLLVIIDTYSAALGSDASNEALANKYSNLIKDLIREYGASAVSLHHPGHFNKNRARGAYSRLASIDTEIRLKLNNGVIAGCTTKMRDSKPVKFACQLKEVYLGDDLHGTPVTSCVVEPAALTSTVPGLGLNEDELAALRILRDLTKTGKSNSVTKRIATKHLRQSGLASNDGAGRVKISRVYLKLKEKGFIEFDKTNKSLTLNDSSALEVFNVEPEFEEL